VFDSRDAERAGLRNAETGFFVQAGDSRPRFVTASAVGARAIGPVSVRSKDGTERTVHPEPSEYEALTRSVRFDVDLPGVKILEMTAIQPKAWDRVFLPTPGPGGQTVLVGIVRDVVLDSGSDKKAQTFNLVLAPGTALPASGTPVLDERGWVVGVVTRASTSNGVPAVECEGIELLLRRKPPMMRK
jgi:S1-C subfamily serine protease